MNVPTDRVIYQITRASLQENVTLASEWKMEFMKAVSTHSTHQRLFAMQIRALQEYSLQPQAKLLNVFSAKRWVGL